MSGGPYPGPCPSCDGPKNSYVALCHFCDVVDEDHWVNAEEKVVRIDTHHMGKRARARWQKGIGDFAF